ncbi:class I SAM-dependent methyltransferase [Salipaludibacillus sp. CUR1]|uniref:class I SAM-dependent methyltransferase n=1 Tax=Salipaludibacillus sp. CUR1 TaxID=2820003 RepID=UPI001E656ED7|nr:class I SAM-dependent methyltransferase [Salipaludibacillus sp. CUR1]MCE7793576.1 class I SAM-dependent methyltransferase [Salipaludibacillus sp. CUR1]
MESHFDKNMPGGSKESSFIAETLDFINQIAPVDKYKNVIDLGCGPGLYSHGLAMKGYNVVGVDFNKKAIEYAASKANKENLSIEYRNEDITKIGLNEEFDVALLIYHLYGSFSPENRSKILSNLYQGLKPGGLVLLDVLSEAEFNKTEPQFMWGLSRKDSPFSNKKHLALYASLKYPNKVTLTKNMMVFNNGDLINYHYWNQYFSIDDLEKEVNEAGFTLEKVYADVNGREYVEDNDVFGAVLKKKE